LRGGCEQPQAVAGVQLEADRPHGPVGVPLVEALGQDVVG
jgi:hypothetical protein